MVKISRETTEVKSGKDKDFMKKCKNEFELENTWSIATAITSSRMEKDTENKKNLETWNK